jgi:hypothetical protein
VTRDSSRAVWLQQARSHLRHTDPVLARLIDDRPDFDPRAWVAQLPPMDLFGALLFHVTGQQLSVRAARRTLARIAACSAAICPPHRTLGSRSAQRARRSPEPLLRVDRELERTRVREQPSVVPIRLRGSHTGSATTRSSRWAASLTACATATSVWVDRGRSGPCCSVEPTETASRAPAAASRPASGPVRSPSAVT